MNDMHQTTVSRVRMDTGGYLLDADEWSEALAIEVAGKVRQASERAFAGPLEGHPCVARPVHQGTPRYVPGDPVISVPDLVLTATVSMRCSATRSSPGKLPDCPGPGSICRRTCRTAIWFEASFLCHGQCLNKFFTRRRTPTGTRRRY